jgi:hypothetical protein
MCGDAKLERIGQQFCERLADEVCAVPMIEFRVWGTR